MEEFNVMVRAEWRRRLGAPSYGRAHRTDLIRELGYRILGDGTDSSLKLALIPVLAELRGSGFGQRDIWHEFAVLLRSVRTVLQRSGVLSADADDLVRPLRGQLFRSLAWPVPNQVVWHGTSPREDEDHRRHARVLITLALLAGAALTTGSLFPGSLGPFV